MLRRLGLGRGLGGILGLSEGAAGEDQQDHEDREQSGHGHLRGSKIPQSDLRRRAHPMSEPHQSRPTSIALGRRTFRGRGGAAAAAGGVEGIVSARRAPAFAQGTKLHVVRWVDFIPAADVELKRQAPEASKALGADVTFEFINANDLQPRITAAIQSGSGADIFQMLYNWPQLYANGLLDVSDVAEAVGKAQGGFYVEFAAAAKVNGRWLAVPTCSGGNVGASWSSKRVDGGTLV